jgi:hypothetical protein
VAGLIKPGIPEYEARDDAETLRGGGTLIAVTDEDKSVVSIREILGSYDNSARA